MTNTKQLRSCRSKSRGRQSNRDPSLPNPNAAADHSCERQSRSPSRVEGHPSDVNNVEKGVGLESSGSGSSNSDFRGSDIQSNIHSNETGKEVNAPLGFSSPSDKAGQHLAPPEVGDNTGGFLRAVPQTIPAPSSLPRTSLRKTRARPYYWCCQNSRTLKCRW